MTKLHNSLGYVSTYEKDPNEYYDDLGYKKMVTVDPGQQKLFNLYKDIYCSG